MAEQKVKRDVKTSPAGIAVFPHLNEPDDYEGKKSFKVTLKLSAEESAGLRKYIDAQVAQAMEDLISEVKPADRKKITEYVPYEEEYDDEENPTGNYLFKFTKNAEFKNKKTGKMQEIGLPLVDAKRKPMTDAVWGGSTLKVAFFCFPFYNAAAKQIGVSLKMQAVQVIDLVTSGGGTGAGYFEDEDGYESKEDDGSGDF